MIARIFFSELRVWRELTPLRAVCDFRLTPDRDDCRPQTRHCCQERWWRRNIQLIQLIRMSDRESRSYRRYVSTPFTDCRDYLKRCSRYAVTPRPMEPHTCDIRPGYRPMRGSSGKGGGRNTARLLFGGWPPFTKASLKLAFTPESHVTHGPVGCWVPTLDPARVLSILAPRYPAA